jgi:hypothetical protein
MALPTLSYGKGGGVLNLTPSIGNALSFFFSITLHQLLTKPLYSHAI